MPIVGDLGLCITNGQQYGNKFSLYYKDMAFVFVTIKSEASIHAIMKAVIKKLFNGIQCLNRKPHMSYLPSQSTL